MILVKDTARKLLLIHGYSDAGKSFGAWWNKLRDRGFQAEQINIANYISLNNEISIIDIGEGLARAIQNLGWRPDEPFDAIVHSTGMLVIRAYLCNDAARPQNLKHLVALAPATWGSPLAQMGRSWLGAIVRGNHQFGPDFLNAGDRVLDGLELGSRFTWDLAHRDLLGTVPLFTTGPNTPYVAVFIGNQPYDGIRELVNQPGTDGTVRWAGCALNTRKITVDLRKKGAAARATISPWADNRLAAPMFAVQGKNHTTLLQQPEDDLADRVVDFLNLASQDDYDVWLQKTTTWHQPALQAMKKDKDGPHDGWQQFVIRVTDEYGDPVPDYVVDLFSSNPDGLSEQQLKAVEVNNFDLDVHAYRADESFRCFHVRLPAGITTNGAGSLWLRLTASSGTELISYQGYGGAVTRITAESPVVLDISHLGNSADSLFHPFTTTLVEIQANREPLPLEGQTRLMTLSTTLPGS
jgi:hypothetical protein